MAQLRLENKPTNQPTNQPANKPTHKTDRKFARKCLQLSTMLHTFVYCGWGLHDNYDNNNNDDDYADNVNHYYHHHQYHHHHMMMMMMMMTLKVAIRDYFCLLTAPRIVSNIYSQVVGAQSCANHVEYVGRVSHATCRVSRVKDRQLSCKI